MEGLIHGGAYFQNFTVVKATQKGKKLKQGFMVTPGNQTHTSRTEGRALTQCANPWPLRNYPDHYFTQLKALIMVPLTLIRSSLVVIRITEPVLPPLFKLPSEATVCGRA